MMRTNNANNMGKKIIALAASVVLLGSLAACEGQVPTVNVSQTGAAAQPNLTEAQEKRIRNAILDTIDQANTAKSADGLDARMTGPQLEIHRSRLAVYAGTGAMDQYATLPRDIAQTVIPTNAGWPRSVFTITTTTEDQQSKRLLVLTQDSARANYKLWGVARLFPGAQLPPFEVPSLGSTMGTAKDTGLVATPQKAVEEYVDLLNQGASSQFAGDFADDWFRQTIQETATQVQQGMEANAGTQQQVFAAVPDQIKVMRSTDGGDLVVAQINSEWTRSAGEGRESLPASDAEKALFGNGTATSTMKVSYVNVVAFYVPREGAKQQITAVGADRYPVKVEAL